VIDSDQNPRGKLTVVLYSGVNIRCSSERLISIWHIITPLAVKGLILLFKP